MAAYQVATARRRVHFLLFFCVCVPFLIMLACKEQSTEHNKAASSSLN